MSAETEPGFADGREVGIEPTPKPVRRTYDTLIRGANSVEHPGEDNALIAEGAVRLAAEAADRRR